MKKNTKISIFCLFLGLTFLLSGCSYVKYTDIEGVIDKDTTLTYDKSPYHLKGDVTVTPGVTLTIEPGVSVQFSGNNWLIVQGRIVAKGTSDQQIEFGPDNLKIHGYRGIRLAGDSKMPPSILSNIYLHESDDGIYLDGAAAEITFSLVSGNGEGIHLWNSKATVEGNQIMDNKGAGIYAGGASPIIRKNTLKGNAIAFILDYNTLPLITNNRVDYNQPVLISADKVTGNYDFSMNDWGVKNQQLLQTKIQIKQGANPNLSFRMAP